MGLSLLKTGYQKISAERSQEILQTEGLMVTLDQAREIRDFLYKFAEMTLSQKVSDLTPESWDVDTQ